MSPPLYKLMVSNCDAAAIESQLNEMGSDAVYIHAAKDIGTIGNPNVPYGDCVEAWFSFKPEIALPHSVIEKIPARDWVAESQQNMPAISAPPFYIHGQHNRPQARRAKIHIEMEAANAFGSGHHATTQACLALLADIMKTHHPEHGLDIGTGSGILAIAAAKHAHHRMMGCDIDAATIPTARQNARKNRVQNLCRFVHADGVRHPQIQARKPYDLIFANILLRPLCKLAPTLAHMAAEKADIILSGSLCLQKNKLLAYYRAHGFHLAKEIRQGDWTSLHIWR